MGGCCQICGYKTFCGALELHHLDPKEKEFSISDALSHPRKVQDIGAELLKCVLLCSNCHREVHGGLHDVTLLSVVDTTKLQKKEKPTSLCPCGAVIPFSQKFCSHSCFVKSRKSNKWEEIDLVDLVDAKGGTYVSLGKTFGVSDKTIRKHYLLQKMAPHRGIEPRRDWLRVLWLTARSFHQASPCGITFKNWCPRNESNTRCRTTKPESYH